MKLNELIGYTRTRIRAMSDDSPFTDKAIYYALRIARAGAVARKVKRKEPVGYNNWQTICLKLEQTKYQDCSCVKVGCDVLKSVYRIPSVVVGRNKPLIKVETFGRHQLPYVTSNMQQRNLHTEVMADIPTYYIQNGKLIVWNNLALKAIMVTGIFEDPTSLESIKICNEQGDEYDVCSYDPKEEEFPLDEGLLDEVVEATISRLTNTLRIPQDTINNAKSEI